MYVNSSRNAGRRWSRRHVWVLELMAILVVTPVLVLGIWSSSSLPALTHFVA